MGSRYQIFHDLNNSISMLKTHVDSLLAVLDAPGYAQTNVNQVAAIRLSMEQIDNLLRQYRETQPGERSREALQALPFQGWQNYLRDEMLPSMAAIYDVRISFEGKVESHACALIKPADFRTICENLVSNAAFAGATRVHVEIMESSQSIDLVVRDNGSGMTPDHLHRLGLGFSTRSKAGHGSGFRIICQLAADTGAIVRAPKSIPGIGTEITISFMKVGSSILGGTP